MPNKYPTKEKAYKYWDMKPSEKVQARLSLNDDEYRKSLAITPQTWKVWRLQWKESKDKEVATLEAKLETSNGDTKTKILDKLADLCLKDGTYRAGEVWLRATGNLVEKSESKVQFELSAGDNIRIAREAEQRVSEFRGEPDGDKGVSQEPPLLSEQVCVDSEQEHGEEG